MAISDYRAIKAGNYIEAIVGNKSIFYISAVQNGMITLIQLDGDKAVRFTRPIKLIRDFLKNNRIVIHRKNSAFSILYTNGKHLNNPIDVGPLEMVPKLQDKKT